VNEQMPGEPPRRDDAGRVVIILVGVGLVVVGLTLLGRQFFWPYLPLARAWTVIRGAGWGLGLIIIGVISIIWTQRPDFKAPAKGQRIYRSRTNRMLGGVLGGLSEYLSMDATLLRLGYAGLSLLFGVWPAIIAYVAAVIIVPEEPLGGPAGPYVPPGSVPPGATPPPPPPPPAWSAAPPPPAAEPVQTPTPAPAPAPAPPPAAPPSTPTEE